MGLQMTQMSAESHPFTNEDLVTGADKSLHGALAAGKTGTWKLEVRQIKSPLFLSSELQIILGFERGKFDGTIKAFLERILPKDRRIILRKLLEVIRRGTELELEFRFVGTGSANGWLLGRGRLYRDDEGRPIRLEGVGFEVTVQRCAQQELVRLNRELERQLVERTAQLEAVNKEFEAFCYSVSHDLRAPLRSIRGFNEVLLERYTEKIDEKGREFLRRASESSRLMNDLIESLLKLSRVSRCEMSRRPVDLSKLAQGIAEELSASDASRTVQIEIMPGLETVGDEHLLRIVLENLLRNAWKFTARCLRPLIHFGFVPAPKAAFFVRDNGVGFDPAYADRLFGVFQKLHSSREFPGAGVGLTCVQRIITRHHGGVWATGEVDRGATFYFSLPSNETD
jgi:signal transduction histidine kinase